MRECPFCKFDAGFTYPFTDTDGAIMPNGSKAKYRVICKACYAEGPPAKTMEMAEKKWDGLLVKINNDKKFKEVINEEMGGVTAPGATLVNTPGMGNAVPASTAGMTGAQQTSDTTIGSGDKWDTSIGPPATQGKVHEEYKEEYKLSDFKGLEKAADMFYPFKILNIKVDPEYGYQNVHLMLIQFKNGDPGLCIYDTEKEEFIEEPGRLNEDEYDVSPEKLYRKYGFIVPGYEHLEDDEEPDDFYGIVIENNLNPYDKIGAMMAKKMGVKQPFKKKDSKTNTIEQEHFDEATQKPFKIQTLDDYVKASEHVKKEVNEEETTIRDDKALKDINAKEELEKLGIAFKFEPAKSGKNRVFITAPMKDVLEKLKQSEWEEAGRNPENTIRKYSLDDKILTIFADGKALPRAIVTTKEITESLKIKKLVPNSITPYLKY